MSNQARSMFRHPEIGHFFQAQPKLENPFLGDGFLQRILKRLIPADINHEVSKDLTRFGNRICNEIDQLADECEKNPPFLRQWDPWGKRVDQIVTCNAWKTMKKITAEEGLVSIGYDKQYGEFNRVYQFAKGYLFAPSSGLYSCPIQMTDGAAKTIQINIKRPKGVLTSGQWLTERKGGSDIGSGTETVAIPNENGNFTLHGYKWFSSATDSDMAITLARIADSGHIVKPGSKGISMFFLKLHKEDGSLNGIQVMRLKNKLGTRQLPTGELLLDGTEAQVISEFGRGIPSIVPMLTLARIQNAVQSVGGMRRILSLARDYSKKRVCFGLPIAQYPLHIKTMAALEVETRGATCLLFETVRLLGRIEAGVADEDEVHLLRLLTPVVKLYTAKKGVGVISEGLELFGGQGYIEDTGISKLLRDSQVLPIWEGTTNILCLDVLRAIGKSKGEVLEALDRNVKSRLKKSLPNRPELSLAGETIISQLGELVHTFREHLVQESAARVLAYSIAEIVIGMCLVEHAASKEANKSDITTAVRWAQSIPKLENQLRIMESECNEDSGQLVYDSFEDHDNVGFC